jgi:tRNA1Val (adenine37-N6)-methyltransferase
MANQYFRFKQFTIKQDKCAMKVGTDGVLLGAWASSACCKKVLDVGTGTGLIALMIAQRSLANIDALEIDAEAALQAEENIRNSPWRNRIKVKQGAFQEYAFFSQEKYDAIVCNPPYFISNLKSIDIKRNLARNSENLTLEDLVEYAVLIMGENARLAVIIPYELKNRYRRILNKNKLNISRETAIKPFSDKSPVRVLVEAANATGIPCVKAEISIKSKVNSRYTDEYIDLVREFYLIF